MHIPDIDGHTKTIEVKIKPLWAFKNFFFKTLLSDIKKRIEDKKPDDKASWGRFIIRNLNFYGMKMEFYNSYGESTNEFMEAFMILAYRYLDKMAGDDPNYLSDRTAIEIVIKVYNLDKEWEEIMNHPFSKLPLKCQCCGQKVTEENDQEF